MSIVRRFFLLTLILPTLLLLLWWPLVVIVAIDEDGTVQEVLFWTFGNWFAEYFISISCASWPVIAILTNTDLFNNFRLLFLQTVRSELIICRLELIFVWSRVMIFWAPMPRVNLFLTLRTIMEILLNELMLIWNHYSVHALLRQFKVRWLNFCCEWNTTRVLSLIATTDVRMERLVGLTAVDEMARLWDLLLRASKDCWWCTRHWLFQVIEEKHLIYRWLLILFEAHLLL